MGCDPHLKRLDHNDFFSAAFGQLVCLQDRNWLCLHAKTLFDDHYQSFRQDFQADSAYLAAKWGGVPMFGVKRQRRCGAGRAGGCGAWRV